MSTKSNLPIGSLVVLALATGTAQRAQGQVESYFISLGGFFDEPGNWSGPVPDETVNAIFDLDCEPPGPGCAGEFALQVQFWHADGASNRVIVRDARWTFWLTVTSAGHEPRFYDAVSPSFVFPSVVVGDTAVLDGPSPILTIRGGVLNSQYTIIGLTTGSTGTINFQSSSFIDPALVNQAHVHVGLQGTGFLNITNGAEVACTDAVLGSLGSGVGEVHVLGSGSILDCAGELTVGKEGQGTLEIGADGTAHCASATVGAQGAAVGQVFVTGIGSMLEIDGPLDVGLTSQGSIAVTGGGAMLSEGFAAIGTFNDVPGPQNEGVGDVTVAGPTSTWIHDGALHVGFQGTGTLDVLDGATVTASSVFAGAVFDGVGVVTVDGAGSVLAIVHDVSVYATLTVRDGGLVIADTVEVSAYGVGGEVTGDGTIMADLNNDGVVAPGAPYGALTIAGHFDQVSGSLALELAGAGAGEYDSLEVTEILERDGLLVVTLAGGFTPSVGDSFTILSGGDLVGAFDSISLPDLGPSLEWQIIETTNSVVLQANRTADLNGDGAVGILDFLALLVAWGPCPPGDCPADLDGDGAVGIQDFLTLLAAWT